jgi:hypothetical protein
MVFDECHKAKNVNSNNTEKSSKTAQNVIAVQQACKQARVVYVSATGASELSHLAYMERLGLWGEGTFFRTNKDFTHSIGRKGTGAMELVAMDLKAQGLFLARSLSYRGAEFTTDFVGLTPQFKRLYDQTTLIWTDIKAHVEMIQEKGTKVSMCQYWSSHQKFYLQMCLGAKGVRLVQLAKVRLVQLAKVQLANVWLVQLANVRLVQLANVRLVQLANVQLVQLAKLWLQPV